MPKRKISKERIEQIRREVAESIANPKPMPEKVMRRLSCGHEELVSPGVDVGMAVCQGCRVESMCFKKSS